MFRLRWSRGLRTLGWSNGSFRLEAAIGSNNLTAISYAEERWRVYSTPERKPIAP